jgi:hypothetical protein
MFLFCSSLGRQARSCEWCFSELLALLVTCSGLARAESALVRCRLLVLPPFMALLVYAISRSTFGLSTPLVAVLASRLPKASAYFAAQGHICVVYSGFSWWIVLWTVVVVSVSEYRSVVGQLNWVQAQSRPDLSFGTSKAACHSTQTTCSHARDLNTAVKRCREGSANCLVFQRGSDVADRDRTSVPIADSSHASLRRPSGEKTKSQCGHLGFLSELPDAVEMLDFTRLWPMWWWGVRVRRSVRSTLAAEG